MFSKASSESSGSYYLVVFLKPIGGFAVLAVVLFYRLPATLVLEIAFGISFAEA